MSESTLSVGRLNYAKISGFFYALIIIMAFIPSQLLQMNQILGAEDAMAAMSEYEQPFRIGLTIEYLMFVAVMVLSWALYMLLKPIHPGLALLAFALRFGEALLGCMVMVFYLAIPLLLGSDSHYLQLIPSEHLQALANLMFQVGKSAYFVLLSMMGIGALIFCYLVYISSYIPRALAVWGMVTYLTMTIYGFANLLMVDAPGWLMYAMMPGALFELVIGFWLLIKGKPITNRAS